MIIYDNINNNLSLVGTTSLGFNLFLGASMAEGKVKKQTSTPLENLPGSNYMIDFPKCS